MIYVDGGGIFSSDENMKEVLKELSKTFVVKDLGTMETFVGCQIVENNSKTAIYVHQPKSIKNLKEHFGNLMVDRHFTTLGFVDPNFCDCPKKCSKTYTKSYTKNRDTSSIYTKL
jgi:hypothetical protein